MQTVQERQPLGDRRAVRQASITQAETRLFLTAGVLLGLGLGGFFDGIVLHQVLQWHHMVTADYPATTLENLQLNTLLDGFFHVLSYLFTAAGLFTLWQAVRRTPLRPSSGMMIGALLMGWGIFNLVEGVLDHHLLAIHHVRSGPNQLAWDIGFLAWGTLMLAGGWLLARARPPEPHL